VMPHRLFPLALVALLAAAPSPARADELATVRAKIAASMRAPKSFVMTMKGPSTVTVTTYVAPDRYHSVLTYKGGTLDVVLVGANAYLSDDGRRTYRRTDAPGEVLQAKERLSSVPVDQLLPDRIIDGKTWGRFAALSPGPQKEQLLTCSFDKTTYRINDCTDNEGLSLTVSRYDDPTNVVTVPANVTTPAPAAHR
jgi:hypothetical protein